MKAIKGMENEAEEASQRPATAITTTLSSLLLPIVCIQKFVRMRW